MIGRSPLRWRAVTGERPAREDAPGAAGFDFWLGEWDCSWTDAAGIPRQATNTVSSVAGSIRELFRYQTEQGDYVGGSIAVFDAETGRWRQDYWDTQGYATIFEGGPEGGCSPSGAE